jgi:hypothetical protein
MQALTRKDYLNTSTEIYIDIVNLFTSKQNRKLLCNNLHVIYAQNGGKSSIYKFYYVCNLLIDKFVKENNLYEFEFADEQATCLDNYVEKLKIINKTFIKECYKHFQWDIFNPFHDKIEVGVHGRRSLKKMHELTPDDHLTLDLWREQSTHVSNKNFKDNNKIPTYRASLHTRHFDKSNEGLRENDPNRSSLETPIYGYDMSEIYKGLDNYKSESWYSM